MPKSGTFLDSSGFGDLSNRNFIFFHPQLLDNSRKCQLD